jgi:hypothetical protein
MVLRLRVPDVDEPDLLVDVDYRDGAIVRLAGTADAAAASALSDLLDSIHSELVDRGAESIIVDLHALDAMATPCFTQLVVWIARLQELPADARYRLRLRGNPKIAWQQHTLHALSCFDTELVTIDGAE